MSFATEFCMRSGMPPEKAVPVPVEVSRQKEIYSVRPTRPEGLTYAGSKPSGITDLIFDYYKDETGTYWYESRRPDEPIITEYLPEREEIRRVRECRRSDASVHAVAS